MDTYINAVINIACDGRLNVEPGQLVCGDWPVDLPHDRR
jgi:hypothetical protein